MDFPIQHNHCTSCSPAGLQLFNRNLEESMNKKSTLILAGLAGLALSGMSSAADVHTQTIASTCLSCHGPHGKSLGAIPSLTGLSKDYFVKAMQNYKSGKRVGTIMKKHAAGYTDAEFEAMGEYFASLK
jgi:cytochrome c553